MLRKMKYFVTVCETRNFTVFNMVARGMGISFVLSDDIAIIKNNPQISICRLEEPIKFNIGFIYAKKGICQKRHENLLIL